jgi:hypothetical protein
VASKSLVKWLKMLWENWGACVWCVGCYPLSSVCLLSVPCGGGVRLPFIGQGEGELHARRTTQLHGGVWCAVR